MLGFLFCFVVLGFLSLGGGAVVFVWLVGWLVVVFLGG